jgi:hypothetical protein
MFVDGTGNIGGVKVPPLSTKPWPPVASRKVPTIWPLLLSP